MCFTSSAFEPSCLNSLWSASQSSRRACQLAHSSADGSVGARPARLDVVDAKLVQRSSDRQLAFNGEGDALGLLAGVLPLLIRPEAAQQSGGVAKVCE